MCTFNVLNLLTSLPTRRPPVRHNRRITAAPRGERCHGKGGRATRGLPGRGRHFWDRPLSLATSAGLNRTYKVIDLPTQSHDVADQPTDSECKPAGHADFINKLTALYIN